jgi:hypothetical protein
MAALLSLAAAQADAAKISDSELNQLTTEASRTGYVPVVVSLGPVTPSDLNLRAAATAASLTAKRLALFNEMGSDAWMEGFWDNRLGHLHFHVPPAGLSKLLASSTAVSFWRGSSSALVAHRRHEAFRQLEETVAQQGSASASVILRNETTEYDIDRVGAISSRGESRFSLDEVRG